MASLWDPLEEMKKFRESMNKMLDDFWQEHKGLAESNDVQKPKVDIENRKKEIVVTVDLPGVEKKDIDVRVERDRIEIKAKRESKKEERKKNFYKKERSYSGFYRAFILPAIVNPDKAKSSFKKSVLTITLPKVKDVPKKGKRLTIT